VIRTGIDATIKVNGVTIIDHWPMGELRGGSIGVVTHRAKGHFDDVSLTDFVESPP
jgi:hypothetical protein